jgi:nucleotide-binding universal stress UspA family protein
MTQCSIAPRRTGPEAASAPVDDLLPAGDDDAAMIREILFPFDFSAQGVQTATFVRALASRLDAAVTLLSVVPLNLAVMPLGMESDVAGWKDALQSRLDQALIAELAGVRVKRITDAGDPGTVITQVARDTGADLVMMPTHGLGIFRQLLVGSTTAKVLHDTHCPVWTAAHAKEQQAAPLPAVVLCAIDGGPQTDAVLTWAADFCRGTGATLKLLHVIGHATDIPSMESERVHQERVRNDAHTRIASLQAAAGVSAPLHVAVGGIVPTVTERAREEKADLVIIGRGTVQESMGRLRTHAYGIVQRSPCPVLSV